MPTLRVVATDELTFRIVKISYAAIRSAGRQLENRNRQPAPVNRGVKTSRPYVAAASRKSAAAAPPPSHSMS
jgi:hypothetical protein